MRRLEVPVATQWSSFLTFVIGHSAEILYFSLRLSTIGSESSANLRGKP
jgi:hypothetical protein